MKFDEFKNIFKSKPVIDSKDFHFLGNELYLRRQVSEWVKKEKLILLKKGIYIVNDDLHLEQINHNFIANYLYQPSYISLEFALRYYQLIPEEVYTITSVTTRKTANFKNVLGNFTYRKISNKLYWGFENIKQNGQNVFMAQPEKAIIDFLYFNLKSFKNDTDSLNSYRFQNLDILNKSLLQNHLKIVNNTHLSKLSQYFL